MPLGSLKGPTDKLGQLRRGLARLGSEGYKTALTVAAGRVNLGHPREQ